MHFSTLNEWLSWIASIHDRDIELGLLRVKKAAGQAAILPPACPVITVGGTNGKGSTVAALESIYLAANYQVGSFTSPFLFSINEEVKINGKPVSDEVLITAFQAIENGRGEISLTPFEFHTLAALYIFNHCPLDVIILEVGLGGRLDAVNIVDADVAIVTSIALDHTDWLGPTRETIAIEKAGIFRENKPAICGDFHPPHTLNREARQIGAPFYCQGKDFYYQENEENAAIPANSGCPLDVWASKAQEDGVRRAIAQTSRGQPELAGIAEENVSTWQWHYQETHYPHLPKNKLAIQNMSTVLMAVTLLQDRLPVSEASVRQGLVNTALPGRIQIIPGEITKIYDVSHNPAAAALLAKEISKLPHEGRTRAVFSMLTDKDILNTLLAIADKIHDWYAAPLPLTVKRRASIEKLQQVFKEADIKNVTFFSSIKAAYEEALAQAKINDRLIIFGSFHTVSAVYS